MAALRDKNWDRQLEDGLPDSRLNGMNRVNTTVIHARQEWELVFCASCGKAGGAVTADWTPHVFYLCDVCALKHGKMAPPGTKEISEDEVRGQGDFVRLAVIDRSHATVADVDVEVIPGRPNVKKIFLCGFDGSFTAFAGELKLEGQAHELPNGVCVRLIDLKRAQWFRPAVSK